MDSTTQAWLELQCQFIHGVKQAVVLLGNPEQGQFEPMAHWPGTDAPSEILSELCQQHLAGSTRLPFSRPISGDSSDVVVAIEVGGRRFGGICLQVATQDPAQLQEVQRLLQWGVEWFGWLAKERQSYREQDDRLVQLIELVVMLLKNDQLAQANQQLVVWLQKRFGAKRVSLALANHQSLSICAVSGRDQIHDRLPETNLTLAAMKECGAQACSIVYPALIEGLEIDAHQRLSQQSESGVVASIPLKDREQVSGVVCLVGLKSFSDIDLRFCEQVALLLGPIIGLKQRPEPKTSGWLSLKKNWPKQLPWLAVGLLLTLSCVISGPHEVTAKAAITSETKQLITAQQDGYIDQALVRPGDPVRQGQLLATLEDDDLQLELNKWQGKKNQFMKSYNVALSKQDRGGVNVYRAQLDQADAQLLLIQEQLKRVRLLAPFDGIVVKGDLQQSLGAPVQRGDVLYEVAKQGRYRLTLDVEEQDVRYLEQGQQGQLLLASLPDQEYPFTVDAITPIAVAKNTSHVFQSEASLPNNSLMRPGMTGVATVVVGEEPLLWLWTHRFLEKAYAWYWAL